jgi:D-xylose transport system ATP-binding protein
MAALAGTPAAGSVPAAGEATVLELRGICKHYGGVRALDEVDLQVDAGEVVAVVGDNGAGKSTLIKAISGVQPKDEGEIYFDGAPVVLAAPRDATDLGIQTVYQDLALCDNLDAVKNLFLGRELRSPVAVGARLSRPAMEERATATLSQLGVTLRSLRLPVGRLSGGQRQSIAICRAILTDPRVVLLDEPTAALGVAQRAQVLDLIRRLRSQGRAVVVISHDLNDVRAIADRVYVLRLGRRVAEFHKGRFTTDQLVAAITGAASHTEDEEA